jgi:DnaK suppressor protein
MDESQSSVAAELTMRKAAAPRRGTECPIDANGSNPIVSSHLTPGQHALLESALTSRLQELDRRIAEHQGGLSRAEHAREVLKQDSDDISHREADRELDMARSDRDLDELGAVSAALRRMQDGSYGSCTDCGVDIPFDRLKIEPEAPRCVACETKIERARRF